MSVKSIPPHTALLYSKTGFTGIYLFFFFFFFFFFKNKETDFVFLQSTGLLNTEIFIPWVRLLFYEFELIKLYI